ncbi:SulP family inorganic anion transporter [Thermoleptolyngbya sichuanensis A183]|uniref:SulP family inorganic anion transporter n=1 Tax=Thermoleptolyngbya sichuanensis A183 TaxID=2737172 RepID=A0A6M8BDV3_9CYAN|nr:MULTISPECIES: SulP family inorganic anion transporter [Thermoleptolyngbya]QKD82460.1 SulP family inorganic anion transporter [Thermoleptolyngbya sichuanensis A183]
MQLFHGLRGVKQADLPTEILAGVTLAALMVPLNIGYAQVAGLPATAGLYSAILPMVAFAIFCTSRQLVASPDAALSALLGATLAGLAAPDDPRYLQLAFAITLLCALVFFLFWYFRLGFLANFLSKAVLAGFITGLGIEVLTSQVKKIMGISVEAEGWFREVVEIIGKVVEANLYTVVIGVGSIVIIRLLKRFAPQIPGALVALVIMTALVSGLNLDRQGVSVLGQIPAGLPSLTFPQVTLGDWGSLLPGALAMCAITLAEGLLLGRSYAQRRGYPIDADQEMFAFGAANLASGLTGGFTAGTSASRTAAMDSSGSRSQVPSLVGASVVALVLLFFTNQLALLPNAALAGIVANAVLGLIEVGELKTLFRVRRSEFWVAIACLLSVLVLGPLKAVAIAFLLSMIDLLGRASKPPTALLAGTPGKARFVAAARYPAATRTPGLLIYRFSAPLIFANAEFFKTQVADLVATAEPPVQWFVLDAEAITDIDVTGAEALEQAIASLEQRQVGFAMTRVSQPLRQLLTTYDLLPHPISPGRLYDTNRQVTEAFLQRPLAPEVV